MPVFTPYMISWALIFSSSMARQADPLQGVGAEFHVLAVAGDPDQPLDGQRITVQYDGHTSSWI